MIIQSDILDWAENYEGEPFHAMLLDPPYHLTSITKRFGKNGSAPAKGDVYNRSSRGFMGQVWDGGNIAFDPATWEALTEHLYPGGFGMAFASSRGWHRLACAIEDAGMIIHPSIFGWVALSGFPKSTRIDTQIDRTAGVEREVIDSDRPQFGINKTRVEQGYRPNLVKNGSITNPTTPLAKTWQSHRYGLQALKPALEPIIVFQKPYKGKPVDSIVATGAGALNIDGGRIETNSDIDDPRLGGRGSWSTKSAAKNVYEGGYIGIDVSSHPNGRWPANFVLSHSPLDTDECHPSCPVRLFDEQSGNRPAGGSTRQSEQPITKNVYGEKYTTDFDSYSDSSPASRMFHKSDWSYEVAEQLANADPVRYEPKVSSTERDTGLDNLETITRHRVNAGGLENEPRFAPTQVKNNHPTLKPISLTKYLSTLLLPPDAYAPRRILIPFCGVASEYIGAMLAGWEDIVGIEREANYVRIAEARLKWWSQWAGWGQTDVDKILASQVDSKGQLSMF